MIWLLRYRRWLLGLIGLLTLVFGYGLTQLRISFGFEDFYPHDDPEFAYYQQFQEKFAEEQNYMLQIALRSPAESVYDTAFLRRAEATFAAIARIEGVDSLLSGTQVQEVRRVGLGFSQRPWLRFDTESNLARSRARIEQDSSLIGSFITRDRQHLCGYLFIERELFDSRERDFLVENLEQTLEQSGLEHVITGIPYIRTKYVEKIGLELLLFLSLSLLLIVTVLWFTYRNLWGVLIPIATVLVSLVWLLGLMGLTGYSVNLLSNLLIPILFVVGKSDVIHLTTKYLFELKLGKNRYQAMRLTLREIGFAIFLTSLTTAIGFFSLTISKVPPIRNFGLFAAIGVLFTFLITIVVLPNALLVLKKEPFLWHQALENQPFWGRWFVGIDRLTQRFPRRILWGFAVAVALCLWLTTRIPLDTYLLEDIGEDDPMRESMEFFEQQAYGLRPFELGFHLQDSSMNLADREVLVEMEKIQDFLTDQARFSPFFSMVSVVKEANYLFHANRPAYRRLPETQAEIDELVAFLETSEGRALLDKVRSEDGQMGRISARLPDIGTDRFEQLYVRLDRFVQAEADTSLFRYRPTGHAFLTEHNLMYVRSSLLGGLSLAFVVIGILMGFLFRSGKMLLISMVPNVIPLIFTGGVMGLFGITLTASTAIVFVIAFGIAVDDTIHMLSRYRLERKQGRTVDEAIRNSLLGTGKAMVMTSVVLMGGFVLLIASDFGGTFNTGLFTALTIVFALLADLLLLPVLLRMGRAR
jgi:uncharacterized protein